MFLQWYAHSCMLLISQLVIIWIVDVGFNNCHKSDLTDHLTQCQWPALVIQVFLLQLPLLQSCVWTTIDILYIYRLHKIRGAIKLMRIIGIFWKCYRACLQALKKWIVSRKTGPNCRIQRAQQSTCQCIHGHPIFKEMWTYNMTRRNSPEFMYVVNKLE